MLDREIETQMMPAKMELRVAKADKVDRDEGATEERGDEAAATEAEEVVELRSLAGRFVRRETLSLIYLLSSLDLPVSASQ